MIHRVSRIIDNIDNIECSLKCIKSLTILLNKKGVRLIKSNFPCDLLERKVFESLRSIMQIRS